MKRTRARFERGWGLSIRDGKKRSGRRRGVCSRSIPASSGEASFMSFVAALSKSRASPLIFDMLHGVLRQCGRIHFEHQQIALAAMNANHADAGPFRDVV